MPVKTKLAKLVLPIMADDFESVTPMSTWAQRYFIDLEFFQIKILCVDASDCPPKCYKYCLDVPNALGSAGFTFWRKFHPYFDRLPQNYCSRFVVSLKGLVIL